MAAWGPGWGRLQAAGRLRPPRAARGFDAPLGLLLLVAGGHLEQVVDDTVDVRVGVRVRVRVRLRLRLRRPVDEDAADGDTRTWCEGVWRDKGGSRTVLTPTRTLTLALTLALTSPEP